MHLLANDAGTRREAEVSLVGGWYVRLTILLLSHHLTCVHCTCRVRQTGLGSIVERNYGSNQSHH
jgi:hypothetical protein